jgi:hypothetical protein
MSVNGTCVEDKMGRFKGECAHFTFKMCPIYTHDGASGKFSTNLHETDYSEESGGGGFVICSLVEAANGMPYCLATHRLLSCELLSMPAAEV